MASAVNPVTPQGKIGPTAVENRPDFSGASFARQPGDLIGPQHLGLAGVAGFVLSWLVAAKLHIQGGAHLAVLFLAGTALPLVLLNLCVLKTHRRVSTGISSKRDSINFKRFGVRLLGLIATLDGLAAGYWLFPEYARDFYSPVWEIACWAMVPLALLTVAYFLWADQRLSAKNDGCWHLGMLILGRRDAVDYQLIKQHVLAWLVKGFFLPLMLAGAADILPGFVRNGLQFETFALLYATAITSIYALDVVFGAVGYSLTIRVLDSHIRSTEPTPLGWFSAVICYVPFSTFVWSAFIKYRGHIEWHEWLEGSPILYVSWGFAILVLHIIYVWATISFGCRFSNLTNRGIITDGPYRFARHPAYLAKNLAWWLMYVPFAAHLSWQGALKGCICLILTNLLYVIRAKTEERHLLRDQAYVAYYEWVEKYNFFAQLKKMLLFKKLNHAGKD